MKKKYSNPIIRLHNVHVSNIIATSDIKLGDDMNETTTQAPRQNGDWAEYNNWLFFTRLNNYERQPVGVAAHFDSIGYNEPLMAINTGGVANTNWANLQYLAWWRNLK